ncbi:MAG: hypothetical protein JSV85_06960, partial [Candidatus Bathyarchaeota archaeon]
SASFIVTLQAPVFAPMQRPAEILPEEVDDFSLKFIGRAPGNYTKLPGLDELLYYIYLPRNSSEEKLQVMVNVDIAKSWSVFHSWQVSLISWPETHGYMPRATQIHDESTRPRKVSLLDNPPIVGLFSAFRDPKLSSNLTLVVLELGPVELREDALSNSTSVSEQSYGKITIYTLTNHPEHFYDIEDVLLLFGEAVVNYWRPLESWQEIALTLSHNGISLMAITTALLMATLALAFLKRREQENSNLNSYQKLASKQERSILQAAHQASRDAKPTTSEIAGIYQKITGSPIETHHLLEKLEEAEKTGLVEKDIGGPEDEPILTWKSRIRFMK